MIKKYAELLVKQGVNLQLDQELIIDASIENYELVREIAKQAYKVGAKDVIVHYTDEQITRLRYENCSQKHFETVPLYLKELRNEYALKNAAIITITSTDPDAMKGIDPQKIATWSKSVHQECSIFYDHLDLGINRWCIAGAPSIAWANKVFPDMSDKEAVAALWRAIFQVTRCYDENPIQAWNNHRVSFEKRVKILNQSQIQSLHYTNSLGTDLIIGMNKGYLFAGGGSYTTDGIYSFPNIPTEEIFTSPCKDKVNGTVYSSMPLNYNGNIIDEFSMTFKDGRIIDYNAKVGYDILKSIIDTDEGSHYLGELALVPYDSPIRNMNILFYNTLFDENASCHLAIGKGFGECIENGLKMNKKELFEKGINDSLTHVDFMIGTSDLQITAVLENGEEMKIFENGNFVF
ncbi:MAG: aminopeptidase [Coprobacillus sp.]|nr:aminopeptidase [Coprobacillus sp.]MCI9093543.1 aminopeptidase [Coprobacillus sp.]